MKKKVIASMLALSMIAGTSSAVFAAENTTAEMADASEVDGTTISFWHSMGGVNGEALDTLVKQFNEENEYGITVDAQYQGEYDDSLNKLKSAQIGNMGADLVQVYEIGTRFMIDSGWIVPMQEMIDGDGYDRLSQTLLHIILLIMNYILCRLIHRLQFSIIIKTCLKKQELQRFRTAWKESVRLVSSFWTMAEQERLCPWEFMDGFLSS